MQALTDVGGMTNYYRDDRLIAAGGDKDGTLDFYEVHYYPQYFDEKTSPFHNPYSHWGLDKPLVVAEFPAKAIADLGAGYKPKTQLTATEAYQYLYNNGYAGAMAWTFYASDFGQMSDVAPAIASVSDLSPEHTQVNTGSVDHIPVVQKPIANPIVPLATTTMDSFVDLNNRNDLHGWAAIKIDPETMKAEPYLKVAGAAAFDNGTTTLPVGKDLYIGTYRGDRVEVLPAP